MRETKLLVSTFKLAMNLKKINAGLLTQTLHEAGQILKRMSGHVGEDEFLEISSPYMTKEICM